jgi:hypothetical protein
LERVGLSSVAWGDYDGDGDLDILLTGENSINGKISRIYRNNGADSFEDINAGLEGVYASSVAWGDYDGDGDLDILLTGQNSTREMISRVYRNDGGFFNPIEAGLRGVQSSSVAWGDYDGDGDLDILLTGQWTGQDAGGLNTSGLISVIYRNDGADTFTDIEAGLEGVYSSSVAWGDYDGDGDLDILLTGEKSGNQRISRIYKNTAGTFTAIEAGLEGVSFSSVAWGDYDGDGDLDILLTGAFSGISPISRIYRNNSVENGQSYQAPTVPRNLNSSVSNVKKQVTLTWDAATDNTTPDASLSYNVYVREQGQTDYITSPQALESDGWRLVPGLGNGQLGTEYIWNYSDADTEKTVEWKVQAIDNSFAGGLFSEASTFSTPIPDFEKIAQVLEGVFISSVAWGDYDRDGDLDILMTGVNSSTESISSIYQNNGDGTFTDIEAGLKGVFVSSVAWGDYDGDGDLDILLTGRNIIAAGSFEPISRIYRNDAGIFFDIEAGLEGVGQASVAWGDYDNDGDLDILLTGNNSSAAGSFEPISRIYRNDGGDTFSDIEVGLSEVERSLEGVYSSSVAWGDYDGDGDLDILLTGNNSSAALSFEPISRIYQNDGGGTFTDIEAGLAAGDRFLAAVEKSSVAWGDYDGDGDLDILLTGSISLTRSPSPISRIYRNDGDGTFFDIKAGLEGASSSSVAWGDYNGDGDLDILLTGLNSTSKLISRIYRNDGVDTFAANETGLEGVSRSSVAWGDYDGDGDLDILLTGGNSGSERITSIYRNNSVENGQSYEAPTSPSNLDSSVDLDQKQVTLTWGAATDNTTPDVSLSYNVYVREQGQTDYITSPQALESDGWRLVPGLGNGQLGTEYTWNYSDADAEKTFEWKVQAIDNSFAGGAFSGVNTFVTALTEFKQLTQVLAGVQNSSVSWGDYDGDGDLDILLTGKNSSNQNISRIYQNNGDETFTDIAAGLEGVINSSVAWGDYDGDGDLDILLTGGGNGLISKIYENNGDGTFTDIVAGLVGVRYSAVAWGDYDGDGDLDILLTGYAVGIGRTSRIYRNDAGTFTDIAAGLPGVFDSSVAWGDYDGDGDLDILLTGSFDNNYNWINRIYRNNGDGTFTNSNAGLESVRLSTAAWGDYDGDGDLDILLTGENSSSDYISTIYKNDAGTFTKIAAVLEGVYDSTIGWGDYDGDGDLDILLTGSNTSHQSISTIYRNNGDETFTDIVAGLEGVSGFRSFGGSAWGDYDGDGDLDILVTGRNSSLQGVSSIYRNNSKENGQSYEAPTAPSNLSTSVDLAKKQVTLTWDPATDNTTPEVSLSYNVYVRAQGQTDYITSPQALETDGWRLVPGLGNGQLGTEYSWSYTDADAGKIFEWKVQAIDNSFAGGAFSGVNTFEMGAGIISISGSFEALDKEYDAEESATIATSALVIEGLLPDAQDVAIASIEIRFADKDAGEDKPVSIFDITLSGADAEFYTLDLTGAPTTTATISALPLAVTGLTANNKEYDGLTDATLSGTPSVTGLGSEVVSIGGTLVGNFAQSDVGTAIAVTVSGLALDGADKANYEILQPIGLAASITPAILTITVDVGQTKEYGSTDQVLIYKATGFVDGDDESILIGSLARDTGEDVNLYAILQGTLEAESNYEIDFISDNFEITKATTTTVVTIATGPFTYTGSAITPATVSVTGAGNLDLTPAANYLNNTNVGIGTASYIYAESANHFGSTGSKDFIIGKADADITVTGYTGIYDASAHGATGTAFGVAGETLSGLDLGASYTNAPGGQADWTFTDVTGNYKDDNGSVQIVIGKGDAFITVTRTSGDYNGNPFEATGSVTGLEGDLNPAVTFEYQQYEGNTWSGIAGAPMDAGAYRVRSNFAGNTDYTSGSSDWTAFAINQIDATITVTRASGDYNGNPFEATGSVTGLEGDLNPTVTFEYQQYDGNTWSGIAGAPTDAGAYRVRSNFAGNTDYTSGSIDWTAFAINQIDATVTVTRVSGDYNGNPFEATGTVTG